MNCSFIRRKLEFIRYKTAVQHGENSSSVSMNIYSELQSSRQCSSPFDYLFSTIEKKAARRAKNAIAQLKFYF